MEVNKLTGFLNRENWKQIERGYEFEAAILYPSDTKRPLSFFIPNKNNPLEGKIVDQIGNFSPEIIEGRPRAREQQVVVTIKPRKVIIVTNNIINQNEEFEYILIAPINTIKLSEKSKDWYEKLIYDEHPIFTYIPKGNIERYVDLSQIMTIHKSLLLTKYDKIPDERMELIDENLLQCLSLGIIKEEAENIIKNQNIEI